MNQFYKVNEAEGAAWNIHFVLLVLRLRLQGALEAVGAASGSRCEPCVTVSSFQFAHRAHLCTVWGSWSTLRGAAGGTCRLQAAVVWQCEPPHCEVTLIGNSLEDKLVVETHCSSLHRFMTLAAIKHWCWVLQTASLPPVAFQSISYLHDVFCYAGVFCLQRGGGEIKLWFVFFQGGKLKDRRWEMLMRICYQKSH